MKINTNFKKITNIFCGVVFYLTSAILSLLILSSLFFTVYIPLSIKEKIEFYNSTWYFPIVIFLFIFVLFKSKKLVEKFSSNIFCCLSYRRNLSYLSISWWIKSGCLLCLSSCKRIQ